MNFKMRRLGLAFICFSLFEVSVFAVELNSVPFEPEIAPPLSGPLQVNDRLKTQVRRVASGMLEGPEDIALRADGAIFTGTADGWVKKISPGGFVENFAFTGGHPLGMDFAPDGRLIVCEPYTGLLAIDQAGKIEILSYEANGKAFKLADDVKVSPRGIAYFSDASHRFGLDQFELDILESRGNGRLLSYNLNTRETKTLAEGLYFANGVALAKDESYVLVAETGRYQITKVWLQGEKQGQKEVFAMNLPGMPDGLSMASNGDVLVAFYAPRSALIDWVQPYPFLKNIMANLPKSWLPTPKPYGFVARYSAEGEAIESWHDQTGEMYGPVTSVEEFSGKLYLGSLTNSAIGTLPLNSISQKEDRAQSKIKPYR